MAYSLSSERPAVAAGSVRPFAVLATWLARAKAERNRRVALTTLLEFDNAMLDDLGIQRQDIVEAMANPDTSVGHMLTQRRAARARAWFHSR